MSLFKADAQVTQSAPGSNTGTFALTIRSVLYPSGLVTNLSIDNIDPDILTSVLQTDIINAVKSYWTLGALDGVRIL